MMQVNKFNIYLHCMTMAKFMHKSIKWESLELDSLLQCFKTHL